MQNARDPNRRVRSRHRRCKHDARLRLARRRAGPGLRPALRGVEPDAEDEEPGSGSAVCGFDSEEFFAVGRVCERVSFFFPFSLWGMLPPAVAAGGTGFRGFEGSKAVVAMTNTLTITITGLCGQEKASSGACEYHIMPCHVV